MCHTQVELEFILHPGPFRAARTRGRHDVKLNVGGAGQWSRLSAQEEIFSFGKDLVDAQTVEHDNLGPVLKNFPAKFHGACSQFGLREIRTAAGRPSHDVGQTNVEVENTDVIGKSQRFRDQS